MPNRAVVDTNILVSALLKRGSPPDAVAQAIRHGVLQPVVCAEIVDEYSAVLHRPRLALPQREVAELIALFAAQAQWVRITPYLTALKLPDPGDWPFIATALAADCPVITGNARHFPKRLGVKVVTARAWVEHPGGIAK
jgi:putative PIN family toxin of toxin-antitoxin system